LYIYEEAMVGSYLVSETKTLNVGKAGREKWKSLCL